MGDVDGLILGCHSKKLWGWFSFDPIRKEVLRISISVFRFEKITKERESINPRQLNKDFERINTYSQRIVLGVNLSLTKLFKFINNY